MSRYAANTEVSASASKAEIERIVERYGATGFMSGWAGNQAVIAFAMSDRQVRFILSLPDRKADEFTSYMRGRVRYQREETASTKLWEQACRQRWRALALVIKAKLEAVESNISTFEDEFMASIVMPNGRTVSEEVRPLIAKAYDSGTMPALLPDYSK